MIINNTVAGLSPLLIGNSSGGGGGSATVWRDGSGAPSNGLGANGDYYLDDATGNVYKKSAGTYGIVANIKGASGPTTSETVFSSRPAAGTAGALAFFSDSAYLQRDNGSSWANTYGPVGILTPPPATGSFSWVNQDTAAAAQAGGAIVLSDTGVQNHWYLKNVPATPYVLDVCLSTNLTMQASAWGLIFSDGTKGSAIFYQNDIVSSDLLPRLYYGTWSAFSAFDSIVNLIGTVRTLNWLRLADDGVTRTTGFSDDGLNWTTYSSEPSGTYLTTTKVGVIFYKGSTAFQGSAIVKILSWLEH